MIALIWLLAGALGLALATEPLKVNVRLPASRTAGKPLVVTVTARQGAKPAAELRLRVVFTHGRARVSALGRPTGRKGTYRARVVLVGAGRWRYEVRVGRRVAARGAFSVAPNRPVSRLAGATAFRACAGAGAFWPTMTLALDSGSAWVACKEDGKLVRLDASSGAVRATIRLPGARPIAGAAGLGSIWVLDGARGTLYRIDAQRNAIAAQSTLGLERPYNLWIGAGSVWTVDDATGEVLRVDTANLRIAARIPVGDGPSSLVFDGLVGWAVNHRDRRLVRFDAQTGAARTLTVLPGDTPERMAAANGSLWITGRGTDLLRVDPATRAVTATVEIGAGGIDVIEHAGSLWVPVRPDDPARSGFPVLAALKRIEAATGAATTVASATGPLDVHGLASDGTAVWLADNTNGALYRIAG